MKTEQIWASVRGKANGKVMRVVIENETEQVISFFSSQPEKAEEQYRAIKNMWPDHQTIQLHTYENGTLITYPLPIFTLRPDDTPPPKPIGQPRKTALTKVEILIQLKNLEAKINALQAQIGAME